MDVDAWSPPMSRVAPSPSSKKADPWPSCF